MSLLLLLLLLLLWSWSWSWSWSSCRRCRRRRRSCAATVIVAVLIYRIILADVSVFIIGVVCFPLVFCVVVLGIAILDFTSYRKGVLDCSALDIAAHIVFHNLPICEANGRLKPFQLKRIIFTDHLLSVTRKFSN